MIRQCPWCSKWHNSKEYEVGWYFVCCATTRLVWIITDEHELKLVPVPEDLREE